MSVKARSSGSPPTLWCSLIVAAGPSGEPPLSITSGYSVPWARNSAPSIRAASSAKHSMKACPIRFRFSCGSVMPARALRKRSSACTTCRSVLKWLVNSSITDWASPARSRPLSTRMHETCVPTASASRAATTELSTPPERPQITRPLPTRSRMVSIVSRAKSPIFHLPEHLQIALRKLPRICWPSGVCVTSGWNCRP